MPCCSRISTPTTSISPRSGDSGNRSRCSCRAAPAGSSGGRVFDDIVELLGGRLDERRRGDGRSSAGRSRREAVSVRQEGRRDRIQRHRLTVALLRRRHRRLRRRCASSPAPTPRCCRSPVGAQPSGRGISTRLGRRRLSVCSSLGLAIPIHWGTYAPLALAPSGHQPPHEDPAAEFAAAAALVAPDVDVRILRPGERTDF